jgi:hypothetical protein
VAFRGSRSGDVIAWLVAGLIIGVVQYLISTPLHIAVITGILFAAFGILVSSLRRRRRSRQGPE